VTTAPQPAATPPAPAAAPQSAESKVYYGGTVSLSFGDVFVIGLHPMIAYKLTPRLSAGVEASYEYVNYDVPDESAHNYGGSVFSRFRLVPQLYAHAEYQVINYEIFTLSGGSSREAVPFVWLGGGFSQPIGPRTWAYVEVLFDVLQDDNSPYSDWEPLYSFGVSVGF
jgi:hypothetical protein